MKKIIYLIYGFEKSGQAAFNLLRRKDKRGLFYIFDDSKKIQEEAKNITKNLREVFVLNELTYETIKRVNTVVLSPGVSIYNRFVAYAKKLKKNVVSELEVGFRFCKGKIIAITGTNGKTTTTRLITEIIKASGKKAVSVGNIGLPLSEAVVMFNRETIFVCEVSSFQLEAIKNFRPRISCLLNITPDHINRHKTIQNYARVKKRIFENQKKGDYFVFNQKIKFDTQNKPFNCLSFGFLPLDKCSYEQAGTIYFRLKNKTQKVCSCEDFSLIGNHNLENVLCAVTVAKLLKIKNKHIVKALNEFKLSAHRMQKIFEKDEIVFYDDSKATNIDSTICAVNSFKQDIILILGGSDKGYDYDLLFSSLPKNVIEVLCCGEVRKKLVASANKINLRAKEFETLKEATLYACKIAKAQECVLLSPASASFDEFYNYKQRGEKFLEYIKEYYG